MKIVIVGGGKVGFAIAREVSAEGHDVTIIDSSRAVCDRLSLALDGMTVQGNGAALDVQQKAGQEKDAQIADLGTRLNAALAESAALETGKGILHLSGAQISMQTLDLEAGEAKLTGRFDGLEYTAARAAGGFWHRLLR